VKSRITLWALVALAVPSFAHAQNESHWGVVASVSPTHDWNLNDSYVDFLFNDVDSGDLRGSEFTIGIARGRDTSGDWGVSYVYRSIEDGSRLDGEPGEFCTPACTTTPANYHLTRGVTYTGVDIHKYVPFVTIKRRVQLGINFGGGVGKFNGDIETHEFTVIPIFTPPNFNPTYRVEESVRIQDANEEFQAFRPFPTYRLEAAAGFLLTPGLKVRVTGGLDTFGSNMFRLTGTYLFGSN